VRPLVLTQDIRSHSKIHGSPPPGIFISNYLGPLHLK
jgi:hypothetical protein